jgi:hypothetical protein
VYTIFSYLQCIYNNLWLFILDDDDDDDDDINLRPADSDKSQSWRPPEEYRDVLS